MTKIEQMELAVSDNAIHCSGCEDRIHTVLSRVSGVLKVKADHNTQRVSVTVDSDRASIETVKQRLEAAGYRAV